MIAYASHGTWEPPLHIVLENCEDKSKRTIMCVRKMSGVSVWKRFLYHFLLDDSVGRLLAPFDKMKAPQIIQISVILISLPRAINLSKTKVLR
mmetsp:Transcript_4098/g.7896  ORF Transcript_4098/g.7896 Transcript_4098/m.7896 type:complete len:93 (+) Transcript_4098:913-1191(+)